MALCKPDLVAGVLEQLGVEVPDPARLTELVVSASAELKRQAGVDLEDCLLMAPVKANAYEGSLREQTEYDGGVKV